MLIRSGQRGGLLAATVLILSVAACSTPSVQSHTAGQPPSSRVSCVAVGTRVMPIVPDIGSLTTVNVTRGSVVVLEVMEPEAAMTNSRAQPFPWLSPASSSSRVLVRSELCEQPSSGAAPATLPVQYAYFRAISQGMATVTAPVSPSWAHAPKSCELDKPRPQCLHISALRVRVVVG